MADETVKQLQCFNIGCNQKYYSNLADDDVCCYHSGEPYFHDAYKEWTCCGQKSTDFSTFLSFKGCKTGKHSNLRKSFENKTKIEEKIEQKLVENEFQFNENEEKVLQIIESKAVALETENKMQNNGNGNQIFCKNCGKSEENCEKECVYHCGQTVFHDSLKYWTCCKHKKFSDFQEFQEFKGCVKSARHEMEIRVPQVREDWFQTTNDITIVLYGIKGCRAGTEEGGTRVHTNGRNLWAKFCDSKGRKLYENEWILKEFIFGENSRVFIDTKKVEIQCEKVSKEKWQTLT